MTDEKYERVREKLDDALDRERTLRHALEWYIGSRFHAMNQTLFRSPSSAPTTGCPRSGGTRGASLL